MDTFSHAPRYITVESVTEGHPDKVCDQIADAILDAYLEQDPMSRVAVEMLGSQNRLTIGGEVTSKGKIDAAEIAQRVYREIGHDGELEVDVQIAKQSPDIAQGVDTGGAGDQGIMYGYATNETKEMLPRSIVMVHGLTKGLADLRRNHPRFNWLRPDGKSQITMDGSRVQNVLISTQHAEGISPEAMRALLVSHLIEPLIGDLEGVDIFINPTGRFVIGGFTGDAGVVGRKIMVDTYCGLVPHGGGAFSGKDPTKVDRSAAYMCRYVAKNLVANGLANKALVSVAYAIGRADPLMVSVNTFGGADLHDVVNKKFDFRPKAIIERLDLRRPIYRKTAAYGHFGRDGFPWENVVRL